jgi:uncharacterized protein YkwD
MRKWIAVIVLVALIPAAAYGYKALNKPAVPKAVSKPAPTAPSPAPSSEPDIQLDTAEIHGLINQERTKAKLKALTINDNLYDSALAKCQDMKKNNYFTHTSPNGYTDTAQLVKEWMQSPKHKENILNPKFTAEGIAVCGKSSQKPGLIIVAHFIQN